MTGILNGIMLLKKIVVAEDDDAIAHMVSMALGDAGFLCLRAKDGQEALHLVQVHVPDLLVLDIMMPEKDGYEVTASLKSDPVLSKIPILMLTALSSTDDKVKGFELGADDYLTKPFDLREFAARVNALIRSANRERNRNPITHLPGLIDLEAELKTAIREEKSLSAIHFSVLGFDALVKNNGYKGVESTIRELGELFVDLAKEHLPSGSYFLGHCGGADFVVLCDSNTAESFASNVRAKISDLFSPKQESLFSVAGIASVQGVESAAELATQLASLVAELSSKGKSGQRMWVDC